MRINIEIGVKAPDFTLIDVSGNEVHLVDINGKKIVLLCLIRGFA